MAKQMIIPTTYGSPSATFWINGKNYVLPTGVEIAVPDAVALLISQHESQKKRERAQVHPDVVDVVFTFAGFNGTESFPGTSNKSFEDIINELGGRGVEHINLRVKNTGGILSAPYRVEIASNQLVACFIGSGGVNGDEFGIRIYIATLTSTSGLNIIAEPKTNLWGELI